MNSKNTSETDELIDAWRTGYRPLVVFGLLALAAQACITMIKAEGEVEINHTEQPNNGVNIDIVIGTKEKKDTNEQDTAKQR